MNKYLETPIKAAIKAGKDNILILYRNYMIATDHRLHVATEADHTKWQRCAIYPYEWKEATPTHHLQ
jgi:hypothetical protein